MPLESIEVGGFRNLIDGRVSLASGLTIVLGPNGQGKTNLLEAVYVLGTGKSFRTSSLREVVGWSRPTALLQGRLSGRRDRRLGLEIGPEGKRYAVDGESVAVSEYLGSLTPIAFTAESSRLTAAPPAARRAFVDRGALGLDARYLRTLTTYAEVLRQKNRMLKEWRRAGSRGAADRAALAAFDAMLAAEGARVVTRRVAYVEALKKNCLRSRRSSLRTARSCASRTTDRPCGPARAR